jgi:4-amino-4-deoxy-L-arabinose transferase-like glycosyltransferase
MKAYRQGKGKLTLIRSWLSWLKTFDQDILRTPERSMFVYPLSLLLICSFALFYNLNIALFEGSEGLYAHISREMALSGQYFQLTYHDHPYVNKPPLFFWVLALATRLFGENEIALRLPGALFSFATVMLTYFLGKSLFSRTAGFWAALVVATSHLVLWYGRRVLFDSMQTFFITLALFAWAKAHLKAAGSWWYPIVGVSMALAVMIKGLHGAALPLVVIIAFLLLTRDAAPLKNRSLHVTVLLTIAILAGYASLLSDNLQWHFSVFKGYNIAFTFSQQSTTAGNPAYWYLLVLWFDFFPWIALLPPSLVWLICKRPFRLERAELFVLVWFFGMLAALSLSRLKREPYLMPLTPALGLMIGQYCDSVWSSSEPKRLATVILRIMLGLLAGGFIVAMIYGPDLLHPRWQTPLSVFPLAFVTVVVVLAMVLGYAAVRSKIKLALGTVAILAVVFSVGVVGLILPAIDAAGSTRRVSDTIKSFPRSSSETLYLYSPRWPGNEDIVYYLNLEPALPRLATEEMLLARVREAGQVLAVMDNTSFAALKARQDLSLEVVHEFPQLRNKDMHLLKVRLAASPDLRQTG